MKVSNETKVGALAAVSITILILGYNFLKGNKFFSNEKNYYAVYDEVSGMKLSSVVILNGLNIGKLKNLEMQPQTKKITATLRINGDIKIPRGTVAKVISYGFIGAGDKAIKLEFTDSKEYHKEGDTLNALMGENISEGVMREIAPIKLKAEAALVSVDSTLIVIKKIFNEKTRANIESAINNLNNSTRQFSTLLESQAARMDKIFANVESITTNLNKSNKDLSVTLANTAAISDSVRKANLLQAVTDAERGLRDFAAVMDKINKGEGSLGLLVNDDKLYRHLDSTASNLDKLMIDLKANPSRYVRISVFGKKDKNKE